MDNNGLSKQKKSLYALALANVSFWAISMITLAILLSGNGNLKGMFVILASGTAIAIQIIATISKTK